MATLMGRLMATWLAAADEARIDFPVSSMRTIPLHELQRFYMAAGVTWYKLLDKLSG